MSWLDTPGFALRHEPAATSAGPGHWVLVCEECGWMWRASAEPPPRLARTHQRGQLHQLSVALTEHARRGRVPLPGTARLVDGVATELAGQHRLVGDFATQVVTIARSDAEDLLERARERGLQVATTIAALIETCDVCREAGVPFWVAARDPRARGPLDDTGLPARWRAGLPAWVEKLSGVRERRARHREPRRGG